MDQEVNAGKTESQPENCDSGRCAEDAELKPGDYVASGSNGEALLETVELEDSVVEPGISFEKLCEMLRRAFYINGVRSITITVGEPIDIEKVLTISELVEANPEIKSVAASVAAKVVPPEAEPTVGQLDPSAPTSSEACGESGR